MNQPERVIDQPALDSQQRSQLRARAHPLKPVVMISSNGASPAVIAEIDRALTYHELIKIRVLEAERDDRETLLAAVCAATGAQPVQHIGRILVIYRHTPKLPAAGATRQPRAERIPRKASKPPARSRTDAAKRARPIRRATTDSPRFLSEERRRLQRRRTPR